MPFYMSIALVVLVGFLLPLQPLFNAEIGRALGAPLWATAANFGIGFLCALFLGFVLRQPWPSLAAFQAVPPFFWLGGLLGVAVVTVTLLLIPVLGATLTIALLVAGQMAASLLLDHYGVLMGTAHVLTPPRLAGVALLVAGIVLIKKF